MQHVCEIYLFFYGMRQIAIIFEIYVLCAEGVVSGLFQLIFCIFDAFISSCNIKTYVFLEGFYCRCEIKHIGKIRLHKNKSVLTIKYYLYRFNYLL